MKLYILIGSLFKFQNLYDSNVYLRSALTHDNANVYWIETNDIEKLKQILEKEGIKYNIKNE